MCIPSRGNTQSQLPRVRRILVCLRYESTSVAGTENCMRWGWSGMSHSTMNNRIRGLNVSLCIMSSSIRRAWSDLNGANHCWVPMKDVWLMHLLLSLPLYKCPSINPISAFKLCKGEKYNKIKFEAPLRISANFSWFLLPFSQARVSSLLRNIIASCTFLILGCYCLLRSMMRLLFVPRPNSGFGSLCVLCTWPLTIRSVLSSMIVTS